MNNEMYSNSNDFQHFLHYFMAKVYNIYGEPDYYIYGYRGYDAEIRNFSSSVDSAANEWNIF